LRPLAMLKAASPKPMKPSLTMTTSVNRHTIVVTLRVQRFNASTIYTLFQP
jgi:hypothetical protein